MSSFKQLSKADVTSVSYAANKQWALPFTCPSISNGYFNVYNGTFITGTFFPTNFIIDPLTNGQYERLVYNSINHLFYQKFSGSLDTSSLMFDINTYQSASQQRPVDAYFDYNINPLLIKNFPTGSGAKIRVLSIDQDIYGSKVLPNSFGLSSSAYNITDDGYGNLYDTGSVHIGNIFYAHGLAIITNPDYQDIFPSPPIAVNNIATFLTTNTSVKTIPILQNDISRSCALDTGSIVLYGNNAAYYTVNPNGTITLNASLPGNYDVYYTVNSICGNGCSLTSNKAKVTARIVQCNPPACITVEFYGDTPAQTFYYVECGTTVTSSLTLNSTSTPVQRCIDANFGVSGSSNFAYVSDCSPSSIPSGCSLYLLCASDRAPDAIFYYTTCSGAPVTESFGTSGDCYFDANYRCITGSITLGNPYGSYQLISLNCGSSPSTTTTSTTSTTTTAAPTTTTTSTTSTTTTPAPTTTSTTSTTTTPSPTTTTTSTTSTTTTPPPTTTTTTSTTSTTTTPPPTTTTTSTTTTTTTAPPPTTTTTSTTTTTTTAPPPTTTTTTSTTSTTTTPPPTTTTTTSTTSTTTTIEPPTTTTTTTTTSTTTTTTTVCQINVDLGWSYNSSTDLIPTIGVSGGTPGYNFSVSYEWCTDGGAQLASGSVTMSVDAGITGSLVGSSINLSSLGGGTSFPYWGSQTHDVTTTGIVGTDAFIKGSTLVLTTTDPTCLYYVTWNNVDNNCGNAVLTGSYK